uniref:Carboxylic ester hydrolase (EC) n=1 Tax=Ganoderma boninense TaxID=34458 RepID=A0A5K1K3H6_9APHY|nr:Carboxylic ester hydrolase (EC [Ganoderma boninense]
MASIRIKTPQISKLRMGTTVRLRDPFNRPTHRSQRRALLHTRRSTFRRDLSGRARPISYWADPRLSNKLRGACEAARNLIWKGSAFGTNRRFRRGWTLQELTAPRAVEFLPQDWRAIGSKKGLVLVLNLGEVAGIETEVLTPLRSFDVVSVARRVSWAGHREAVLVNIPE